MRIGQVLSLFASNIIWRTTGLSSAGRKLVDSLDSSDEEVQVIAGMLLVKAGRQAEPLLQEALRRSQNLPTVLTILGDIGAWRCLPELHKYSQDASPEVAQAAQAALMMLAGQLHGADLRASHLRGVKLPQADLSRANLSGSDLSQADLSGANLSGADLRGANLDGAELQGADLNGAIYDQATTVWPVDFDPTETGAIAKDHERNNFSI